MHSLFLVYFILVCLSISACFGRLWAHHQQKQLGFCDTWYLLCTLHTRQWSTQNNKYQVPQKHNCLSWWWAHSRPKHVEIDKHTKNKLCNKLVLFTRLYRDARSTKHTQKENIKLWECELEWTGSRQNSVTSSSESFGFTGFLTCYAIITFLHKRYLTGWSC